MSAAAQLLAEDSASRRRALEHASFIVEAPAGAGKTELLTQRYLSLLASVAEPEEIVAITFTNKAAAEMRQRILDSLDMARSGVLPAAAHKQLTFELAQAALAAAERQGWGLAAQPSRLRVVTIDALCAGLARQMPILSRFGAQPRVAEDAQRHYAEAARRTLALVNDDGAAAEAVAAALRHLDNDAQAAGRLLAAMLARRDQWLRHALGEGVGAQAEQGLCALVARDLATAAAALEARLPGRLQAQLQSLARYAAGNLAATHALAALADWQAPLCGAPEELPRWRGLCELLLTKEDTLRRQLDVRIGFPAGKEGKPQKDAMTALLAELAAGFDVAALARVRQLPDPFYTAEEAQTVDALATLLRLAAAQLWTVFHEAGETDFIEVAQRALQALGDVETPSELALRLDYRLQHLLVDEFQDTSPTQVELLRRLTAGWTADDGRTLFTVGDPMQSIYRFRKADVGLFLRAQESGIGPLALQRLRLTRNNRSTEPIVASVNHAFAEVFPAADSVTAGAIAYRPFTATRSPLAGAGVVVHGLVAERENRGEGAALEAQRVLEIIEDTRRSDPQRVIAVLVRAREHLTALIAAIRRECPQLRYQAVEIEALAARQSVQDMLALTRALLHRADRVNWLAVLRAPWCGLLLADLHALAADDHRATLWTLMNDAGRVARLSADGQARLAHVRQALGAGLAQQGRQPLARWIEGVWQALGGPGCLRDAAELADVRAFLARVDRLDAAGRFQLDRLEADMAALYAAPDGAADGTLQFMTIHKSKGLEFDTVILPGLHRRGRGDDAPLMRWEEVALDGLDECLVAAPLRKRGSRQGAVPTPFDYIGLLERERAANEAARVLYVAATRAVRTLHLVGVAERKADGTVAAPGGSFLALLWETLGAEFMQAGADDAAAFDESPAAAPFVSQLVRAVAPALPVQLAVAAPPAAAPALPAADEDEGGGEALDASVGTLVHAYLEAIARSGPADWPAERIAGLAPAIRLWLARAGHAGEELERGGARVAAVLQTTLASADGRWVLAPRAGAAAELALASRNGAGVATHVVDRTFVEDGVRWIVDYKTARVAGAAALATHAERYRAQLERYAALFGDEGLPQRLAVFYAAQGRLVTLPTGA